MTIARDHVDWFFEERVAGTAIFAPWIGTTGGSTLKLGEARAVPVEDLVAAHERWFPAFMSGGIGPEN